MSQFLSLYFVIPICDSSRGDKASLTFQRCSIGHPLNAESRQVHLKKGIVIVTLIIIDIIILLVLITILIITIIIITEGPPVKPIVVIITKIVINVIIS